MAFEVVPCALGGPIDEVQEQVFEDDYEKKHGEGSGYVELALRAVDSATGAVLGACTAEYWYGGLVITRLVVEPGSRRRRGIGSALLLATLEAGAAKGSLVATVQTFAHQAPDWYPRFGFKELFRRHGYGAARTFFYFVRQYSPGEAFPRPPSLEPSIRIEAVDGGHTPEVLAFCRANFDQHGMEALGDTARVSRFAFAALSPELAAEARRAAAAATEAASAAAAPAASACASDTVAAASGGLSSATAAPAAPAPTLCPLPSAKKILGTIEGLVFWGGLQVKYLVVREEARGRGIGGALLAAAEAEAARLGCNLIALETMSYQVPDFYAARGYRLDGTAGGWKGGAAMHYFSKLLRPESLHGGPFVEPAEPITLPAGDVTPESADTALIDTASK